MSRKDAGINSAFLCKRRGELNWIKGSEALSKAVSKLVHEDETRKWKLLGYGRRWAKGASLSDVLRGVSARRQMYCCGAYIPYLTMCKFGARIYILQIVICAPKYIFCSPTEAKFSSVCSLWSLNTTVVLHQSRTRKSVSDLKSLRFHQKRKRSQRYWEQLKCQT